MSIFHGGGNKCSKTKQIRNLFVVWLLTGIWHGANWTFIAWGLLYFIFLLLEKETAFGNFISKHKIFAHVYTLLIVNFLWVIFRADGIGQAFDYIRTMLGFSGVDLYSRLTYVYIRENFFYLIFAIILSAGAYNVLCNWIQTQKKGTVPVADFFAEIALVAVFIVSVVYVINGTYNPFIYFNF